MNKIVKSLLVAGVLVANSSSVFAATAPQNSVSMLQNTTSLENQITSNATLNSKQSHVKYSKFLENGGGELWIDLVLDGAKFNTGDPYEIKDAISQNYDIETSLAVGRDGKSIEFGVYEPNAGIEYIDNWVITIDSSVLTTDEDLTVKIPVVNDTGVSATPKVVTNKTSVKVEELEKGFDITLEGINGAKFNTACVGNYVRQSVMRTSNIDVYALPYCDVSQTKVKLNLRAMNGVSYMRDALEFRIEGDATNSPVPLIVKIPIVR
ncbi:hypothetical protein CHL78_006190 [Romboutsia weinsteinii]|uniref:Uncharacterized protein n=1 Tax=Romboutsia weinsteinii TaxID=2020949 RepID=A0A371J602_9FIRM|nr:hypothetical protein [Romboutsia weinsteinii]RDY28175.1 hypothetical protein CHL78_006190 [Romboutsia weinsteinii]